MVQSDGSDEEVERSSIHTRATAALTECGGVTPEGRRRRKRWHQSKLTFQPAPFIIIGKTESFEDDRFREARLRIENMGSDEVLEVPR